MLMIFKKVLRKVAAILVRATQTDGREKPVDLELPQGETLESIDRYLRSFAPEGARIEEMDGYLRESLRRFLYTLSLIPDGSGNLLEIGSNPYYMTLLVKKF